MRNNITKNGWYWEGMEKDIAEFVQNCKICVEVNSSRNIKPPIKQILSTNHERFITDLWELPSEIRNNTSYNYILDIIDHFSKFIGCYPLITKSSKEVLTHIKYFIETNGKPSIIQTDNGKEFVNSISDTYYNNEGIKHVTSSPYHPETQGCVEVSHKEMRKAILSDFLNENINDFNLLFTCKKISDNHNIQYIRLLIINLQIY